ncbi:hypothetical protein KIPB_007172 [Kipferlia bialata]|uniref:Uncharacterized protein n=1 Tax=Kipferlia bialata TaxID=797122 RepID=A0A9K3GJU0_9EUKA|nr:hypothetical protein KIPB_007172 [Kipferlia bialata]|eukprot:g7172.t1
MVLTTKQGDREREREKPEGKGDTTQVEREGETQSWQQDREKEREREMAGAVALSRLSIPVGTVVDVVKDKATHTEAEGEREKTVNRVLAGLASNNLGRSVLEALSDFVSVADRIGRLLPPVPTRKPGTRRCTAKHIVIEGSRIELKRLLFFDTARLLVPHLDEGLHSESGIIEQQPLLPPSSPLRAPLTKSQSDNTLPSPSCVPGYPHPMQGYTVEAPLGHTPSGGNMYWEREERDARVARPMMDSPDLPDPSSVPHCPRHLDVYSSSLPDPTVHTHLHYTLPRGSRGTRGTKGTGGTSGTATYPASRREWEREGGVEWEREVVAPYHRRPGKASAHSLPARTSMLDRAPAYRERGREGVMKRGSVVLPYSRDTQTEGGAPIRVSMYTRDTAVHTRDTPIEATKRPSTETGTCARENEGFRGRTSGTRPSLLHAPLPMVRPVSIRSHPDGTLSALMEVGDGKGTEEREAGRVVVLQTLPVIEEVQRETEREVQKDEEGERACDVKAIPATVVVGDGGVGAEGDTTMGPRKSSSCTDTTSDEGGGVRERESGTGARWAAEPSTESSDDGSQISTQIIKAPRYK